MNEKAEKREKTRVGTRRIRRRRIVLWGEKRR